MRRGKYEFKPNVIETAYRKSEGKCEHCGVTAEDVGKTLEAHHVVPICIARLIPELSSIIISSLANCELLCYKCHKHEHRKRWKSDYYFPQIQALLSLNTRSMFIENTFEIAT